MFQFIDYADIESMLNITQEPPVTLIQGASDTYLGIPERG